MKEKVKIAGENSNDNADIIQFGVQMCGWRLKMIKKKSLYWHQGNGNICCNSWMCFWLLTIRLTEAIYIYTHILTMKNTHKHAFIFCYVEKVCTDIEKRMECLMSLLMCMLCISMCLIVQHVVSTLFKFYLATAEPSSVIVAFSMKQTRINLSAILLWMCVLVFFSFLAINQLENRIPRHFVK